MCYHPIKIRNPSLFINEGIDKPYIEVPCGKCEECVQNKIEELVTRSYYEWRRCVNNGGFAYFDTLTYRPSDIPIFHGEYIFSRKHLTDFLKRLRIRLHRDGYNVTTPQGPNLRYLITCEYGDTTHRPHYHVIWFINIPGMTLFRFYHYVRKCWQHGFNDKITEVQQHLINRIDGIRYVCKYLTKDTFYFTSLYTKLLEDAKNVPEKCIEVVENLKNIKPFYRSSLGYGIDILKVDRELLVSSGVPVGEADGKHFKAIPRYIKYKLFYDKQPHPLWDGVVFRRNEFGISYLVNNLDKVIDEKTLYIKNLLNNASVYGDFETSTLVKHVNDLLDGRDLRKYVEYCVVYKGHLFSAYSFLDYKEYYERWLCDPKPIQSPFIVKSRCDEYLNDYHNQIIDDKCIKDCLGFDEIDDIVDYLRSNQLKFREHSQLNKKQLTTRMHEVCTRFGLIG